MILTKSTMKYILTFYTIFSLPSFGYSQNITITNIPTLLAAVNAIHHDIQNGRKECIYITSTRINDVMKVFSYLKLGINGGDIWWSVYPLRIKRIYVSFRMQTRGV